MTAAIFTLFFGSAADVDPGSLGRWCEDSTRQRLLAAYHFFTFCAPAADQARNFLAVAPPDPAALAPAVDLELAGNCRRRPARAEVEAEVGVFLPAVEQAWGRPLLLYVGDDFESRYPVRERLGRDLWHRRFLRRPDVARWTVWQLHGYAHVAGIHNGVDLNVMRPAR